MSGNTTVKNWNKNSLKSKYFLEKIKICLENKKNKRLYKSIAKSKVLSTISPRNIEQIYRKSKVGSLKVKKRKKKHKQYEKENYKISPNFKNNDEKSVNSIESSKIIIPQYKICSKSNHMRNMTEGFPNNEFDKNRHFGNLNLANYQKAKKKNQILNPPKTVTKRL